MKIIIFNNLADARRYSHLLDSSYSGVSRLGTIQRMIKLNPDVDFEGIILPGAEQNPDFIEILQRIYRHKQDLYYRTNPIDKIHIQFANKMIDRYGTTFS